MIFMHTWLYLFLDSHLKCDLKGVLPSSNSGNRTKHLIRLGRIRLRSGIRIWARAVGGEVCASCRLVEVRAVDRHNGQSKVGTVPQKLLS